MRKQIIPIIISIGCLFVAIGAIFIDIYVYNGVEGNYSTASSIAITVLTVIFTVWFSYLLAVKQIYLSKYMSENIKRVINRNQKIFVIDFIGLFIYGLGLNIFGSSLLVSTTLFCLLCLLFLLSCALDIYRKIDKNEINITIKNKVDFIISEMEGITDQKKISIEIKRINEMYNDCVCKNDIASCKQVIDAYSDFLTKHIEEKNKKIIVGDNEIIKKENELIFKGIFNLFIKDSSDFTLRLNKYIFSRIYKLSAIAIKCNEIELLDHLLNMYHVFLCDTRFDMDNYLTYVYKFISDITNTSIDADNFDAFELSLKKVMNISLYLLISTQTINSLSLNIFYYECLLHCVKSENEHIEYNKYINKLFNQWVKILKDEKLRDSKVSYTMLTSFIEDDAVKNNETIISMVYSFIEELTKKKYSYSSDVLIEFMCFALDEFEENNSLEFEKLMQTRNIIAHNAILYMSNAPSYIFPNYVKNVARFQNDVTKQSEYAKDMSELISLCISKNQNRNLSILLKDVADIICAFKQQEKSAQVIWLDVFFDTFYFSSLSENQQSYSLTLRNLKYAIKIMDNNRSISKDLGYTIIGHVVTLCSSRFRKNIDVVCEMVEFLNQLLSAENNFYFINKYPDMKPKVYQAIFYIGVDAVEKNQVLVIQRVSNVIGWLLYYSIKDFNGTNSNLLIDYAIQLYSLCFANNIETQTIVFVGTLFVIICSYCKFARKFNYYSNIVNRLKLIKDSAKYIVISAQLRESMSDDWDILGKDPKKAMREFISDFTKK